jgi:hypothetical protein
VTARPGLFHLPPEVEARVREPLADR